MAGSKHCVGLFAVPPPPKKKAPPPLFWRSAQRAGVVCSDQPAQRSLCSPCTVCASLCSDPSHPLLQRVSSRRTRLCALRCRLWPHSLRFHYTGARPSEMRDWIDRVTQVDQQLTLDAYRAAHMWCCLYRRFGGFPPRDAHRCEISEVWTGPFSPPTLPNKVSLQRFRPHCLSVSRTCLI